MPFARSEVGRILDVVPVDSTEDKLWALSRAAVVINAKRSIDEMLQAITEQARAIIGAHLGSTSLTMDGTGAAERWPQHNTAVSMSSAYADWRDYRQPSQGSPLYGLVCEHNEVVRLTDAQLRSHPAWRDFGDERDRHLPMRGWLAAPLVASDGSNLGLLQLSDRLVGDFVEADEAILVQLAQLAALAVEKAQLLQQRDRQADQLRALAEAAVTISSPLSVHEILERITKVAVDLVGVHQAVTSLTDGRAWEQVIASTYLSEKYAAWREYAVPPDGSGIYARSCERNEMMRFTQEELEAHPDWRRFGDHAADHPPLRGWLAVPLATANGENLGLIQLSDPLEGEFTEDDEALIVQLGQLASVALENAQLHQELVARERQQLTQDLLAGLSHDMQTPLAVILGLSRVLGSDPLPTSDQLPELAEMLQTQGERLGSLIRQFLDYVRLEAGEPLILRRGPVEVTALVDPLLDLFAQQRHLDIDVVDDLPAVDGDPDRITQVLANLIGNAIKFSDDPVTVRLRVDGAGVAIDVVDQGVGIAPEEHGDVFAKLYRGTHARDGGIPGHGLGLYVSQALMESMGGELTLESTPGTGSRFTAWLPAHGR